MNNVKNISIKGFLARRGITPQAERGGYGMYLSPLREERTPSFKVDYGQNLWYDFGLGEGGSIIDLVSRMEGCTVGEAIRRLEGEAPGNSPSVGVQGTGMGSLSGRGHGNGNAPVPPPRSTEPERPRIEIVSVGELKHPALVEYLRERGIDLAAARKYCNEVKYATGGREYFAIGFATDAVSESRDCLQAIPSHKEVTREVRERAGGWELRNRSFKGSSTPKNITTISNGSDAVMVFEGFIDFLSYLSLKANPSPSIDTAVMNSVANLRRAIPFLESHRTVHAFLDNDDAGRKTLDTLRELLPGSDVVDQSAFYRANKDLNDYWREQADAKIKADNRVEDTNAADTVKRKAPTITTPAADRFRRSVTVAPVKKKGRGL